MGWKEVWSCVRINGKAFWKNMIGVWSVLAAVLGVVFVFVDWATLGLNSLQCRLAAFLSLMVFAAVLSLWRVCCMQEKNVFGSSENGVMVQYGDLLEISRRSCTSEPRIVVIPVNRCFDMTTADNLVTPNSIHGKWLTEYIKDEVSREKLAHRIETALHGQPCMVVSRHQKPNGNRNRYEPGTVVEVPGPDGVTFYLLAMATYKNDLEVTCSEREFYEVIQGLVDYHMLHGRGNDLYCPIMCDHIVQPPKASAEVLELILAILKYNKENIHGKIHVVVYDKHRDEVPISGC